MNRALLLAGLAAGGYYAYRALKPRYDFRNKHALVTGGARGLGLVLARQLADAGARVSICSRDAAELRRAEADLRGRGAEVYQAECDLRDAQQVRDFVRAARAALGPVDVLIHNAGVIQVGPLAEMTEADFRTAMDIHFWAAYHLAMAVLPEMKRRGAGRIVNIASIGGKVAVPHLVPYAASKFALVGLSDGLRAELKPEGVTVTTVCPGLMRTGSHLNARFKGRHEEEYAWFAAGNATPGLSMGAESAARKILNACAVGDAELVLGLPAKLAVLLRALAPNLTAGLSSLVDDLVLPEPGGVGERSRKGRDSRGKLPAAVTTLSDRAARRNNELRPA